MRLHYYKDPHGNFGDDLNPWLWSRLIPDLLDNDGRTLFVGIGTILRREIPREPGKVVFGSGAGYGTPPVLDERWRVYCVRGPHTAAALGLEPGRAITDPALLVRCLRDPAAPGDRFGTAFIPHHESVHRAAAQGIDLEAVARSAGLVFIDPRQPVERVMDSIWVARRVLTEAMHGAILADAWRVPWRAVRLYPHVLGSKWVDWTASLRLRYAPLEPESGPVDCGGLARFLRLASVEESGRWQLSEEACPERRADSPDARARRAENRLPRRPGVRRRGCRRIVGAQSRRRFSGPRGLVVARRGDSAR
jgi:succinoglycan biosynthesis protein ExoV